jgi:hypothetical protein
MHTVVLGWFGRLELVQAKCSVSGIGGMGFAVFPCIKLIHEGNRGL